MGDVEVGQKQLALLLLYIRPRAGPEYSQQTQLPTPSKLHTTKFCPGHDPSEHALALPVTAAHALVACALLIVPSATQS